MKYFALFTCSIFVCYLLGFIKKLEKYQWMDRNYTTAIKGLSILTVVWAHSGAMLSVGGIQFIAGIGVALFLMCSGYGLEISHEKNGLIGFWKKRLLGVCLPFWAVELIGLLATGTFSIKTYLLVFEASDSIWLVHGLYRHLLSAFLRSKEIGERQQNADVGIVQSICNLVCVRVCILCKSRYAVPSCKADAVFSSWCIAGSK